METKQKLARRQVLALTAGLAAFGLAGCGRSVPETIKIGVGTTLSGPSGNRGNDILNGVKLAVDALHREGYKVDGHDVRFEVISADDKGSAEGAKAAAQQLLDQGVSVVFGHLASDVTLGGLPVYATRQLPVITTSSAKEVTTQGGGNVFRLVASDAMQAQALASYGASVAAGMRAAVINEDSVYGRGVREDLVKSATQAKLEMAVAEKIDPKSRDFAAFARKLKEAKVGLLFAVLREAQLLALAEALKAEAWTEMTVLLSNPAKTNKVAATELPFRATYVVSSALDVRDFGQGAKFLSEFRKAFNSDPVWAAHYAYDGMFAVADAIRRARSVQPEDLNRTLKTIDPVTWVTQTMRFGADGEQANPAIGVYQATRGAWTLKMSSAVW
ncbi:MAG: branched-chain amino acid ABC transporter substrate-binding protein [Piscinibacter sp.]|nr:branched-chain amino acid ABC transporter substrate-binding protein [Piscinibacter sp.]